MYTYAKQVTHSKFMNIDKRLKILNTLMDRLDKKFNIKSLKKGTYKVLGYNFEVLFEINDNIEIFKVYGMGNIIYINDFTIEETFDIKLKIFDLYKRENNKLNVCASVYRTRNFKKIIAFKDKENYIDFFFHRTTELLSIFDYDKTIGKYILKEN